MNETDAAATFTEDKRILLENTFYDAEESRMSDPLKSLHLFERCVVLVKDVSGQDVLRWQWKSLEQVVLLRAKLRVDSKLIVEAFSELLTHMNKVTPNEVNDTINNILDVVSGLPQQSMDNADSQKNLDELYDIALEKLKSGNNERLWFNANLKRGKSFLNRGEYDRLANVLKELHASKSVNDPINKGSYFLEVYALEIAMYSATKEKQKMRETYSKTQALSAAIQDPRIMGGIHESGGKMYMEEGLWGKAYDEFFAGFRHMQEAGDSRAKQCLKLVVLANMLAVSTINPFDSREAKVYQNDEEIKAMLNLRTAFENSDIKEFERVLRDPKSGITSDPFINKYTSSLLKNIRSATLVHIVRPYNRIRLTFLGREVGINEKEAEDLVAQLILDGKIEGRIDQQGGLLDLSAGAHGTASSKKYAELESWIRSTSTVTQDLYARVISFGGPATSSKYESQA